MPVGPSKSNIAIVSHTLSLAHQAQLGAAPVLARAEVLEPCCGDTFAVAVLATTPTTVTMAVQRTDSGVGWDQDIQLRWHALRKSGEHASGGSGCCLSTRIEAVGHVLLMWGGLAVAVPKVARDEL